MNKSIISLAAVLFSTAMSAQTLTLEQCVDMALENNARMKNAQYNVAASKETSKETFTKYFPSVSIGGAAFTANHGMLQHSLNLPLSMLNPQLPDMDYNLSVLKKGTLAGINLVQPIFMGGQIVNGNRLAQIGEKVSKLQQQQTEDEVRRNVEQYYWQLVTLHSKQKTVNHVIAMLDTLTQQVQSYVDAGVTTINDLLEVKLKRNEMLSSRTELDNGISVVRMLLSQYIGMGTSGNIDVEFDTTLNGLPPFPQDIYQTPEDCLTQTVGFGLLNQNLNAKELEKKIAVGNNLPMVAAGAGYNYEHLMDQGHSFANVYVTVSIPLTDWWGGSHNIKKKKIESQIARNQLEDNSQLLIIGMTNAWNNLTSAYSQIEIANESVGQSAENLRLNENFYKAGTVTVTDLLNAQTLYLQANDKYVEAYCDFQLKKLAYLQSTGR